jgi:hypothetical protein
MSAASAASGSNPLSQIKTFDIGHAQQALATIQQGQVSTEEAFANLQVLLAGALDYAEKNEKRADLREKQISELIQTNGTLETQYVKMDAKAADLQSANTKLGQDVDDAKVLREKEEYLDRSLADSHGAGAAAGIISGGAVGAAGTVITASFVALPVLGLPVGVATGMAVQNLSKGGFRQALREEVEKYENEFFANNPQGTKREAFEYAKEKIKEEEERQARLAAEGESTDYDGGNVSWDAWGEDTCPDGNCDTGDGDACADGTCDMGN